MEEAILACLEFCWLFIENLHHREDDCKSDQSIEFFNLSISLFFLFCWGFDISDRQIFGMFYFLDSLRFRLRTGMK